MLGCTNARIKLIKPLTQSKRVRNSKPLSLPYGTSSMNKAVVLTFGAVGITIPQNSVVTSITHTFDFALSYFVITRIADKVTLLLVFRTALYTRVWDDVTIVYQRNFVTIYS